MPKIVNSWNEWDPLKRIIVGRPEGTQVPGPEPGDYSDQPNLGFPLGKYGPFPQELVDAANEQMDNFVSILEGRGIVVDRVDVHPAFMDVRAVSTPDWTQTNVRGTNNPRDLFMTVGNEIIEAPGALRSRWYEYLNLRPIFERYFKEDPEFLWTSAPKPRLTKESYEKNYFYNFHKVWSDEVKRERMEKCQFQLTEKEPMWDAACAMRYGRDVTWFHSTVANFAAIDWLKRYLGAKGIRISQVQVGVVILQQTATTTMTISISNPTRRRLEAEMIVPVPDGAVVRSFTFQGKGSEPVAEILPKDQATKIYNQIVAKIKDPALLEFLGYNMIRSSVFPVEAGGTQKKTLFST